MPSISDALTTLQRFSTGLGPAGDVAAPARLVPLETFGLNPGKLRGLMYAPADLPENAPLVVVLHGCTQTADAYDRGSGWSTLADRFGFAVLYAEQQRANNPNLCFNWFVPADTRRGGGEAESIREMVVDVTRRCRLDPSRVFITGLSAGGAMTSVMLALYPELFAAGAIIAGLPFGMAAGVPQAMERMRGHGYDRTLLSGRVRAASGHEGRWPAVSVWHGTADTTVNTVNAAMIVDQWRGIHGVDAPDVTHRLEGGVHRIWHDKAGRVAIEQYTVEGLGHGTPITTSGDEACGVPAAHMLAADISSTYRIAASWGIAPETAPSRPAAPALDREEATGRPRTVAATATTAFDPAAMINDALRAAGLMRP